MRTPLDRGSLPQFEKKIERLRPDATPQFGSLTAHRMVVHLDITFQISLEEAPCEDLSNWILRSPPVRWLIINMLPMPKGVMKGPGALTPEPVEDFENSKESLNQAMYRFVEEMETDPKRRTFDPWLGRIPLADWSKIHGLHLQHHLGQFGV